MLKSVSFSCCSFVLLLVSLFLLQQNMAHSVPPSAVQWTPSRSVTAPLPSYASKASSLIIIDAGIQDYPQLFKSLALEQGVPVSALPSSVHPGRIYHLANQDWLVLSSTAQSIDEIGSVLSNYQQLETLHYFSHGQAGNVQFGSQTLSLGSLTNHTQALSNWKQALAANAQVLLYGCEVAKSAQGKQLIQRISQQLGVNVSASDDLTGAKQQQGDWELEYHVVHPESFVSVAALADTAAQQPRAISAAKSLVASAYENVLVDSDGDGVDDAQDQDQDQDDDNDGVPDADEGQEEITLTAVFSNMAAYDSSESRSKK